MAEDAGSLRMGYIVRHSIRVETEVRPYEVVFCIAKGHLCGDVDSSSARAYYFFLE